MKFGNLLKKELRELLTPQTIFSMIFTCVLFIALGNFMSSVIVDAVDVSEINICVQDDTEFTRAMLSGLEDYGCTANIVEIEGDDYFTQMDKLGIESLIIIPEGFSEGVISAGVDVRIKYITMLDKGGISAMFSGDLGASSAVAEYVSDYYKFEVLDISENDIQLIEEPLTVVEYTCANGETAEVSAYALKSMIMFESMIAPIVVFMLLMMASQTVMAAISTEKIDKTLETLLSAPVSRISVLSAKMLAAIIVALLNAASMAVGMIFYMQSMISPMDESVQNTADASAAFETTAAMTRLGLTLSVGDIFLFGLQIFLSIAIGLSISLILGAMANDAKSVQSLTLPIMMAALVPYFVTMFTDVNSLPAIFRAIMYVIPFTHAYISVTNLSFGHTAIFWAGLAYQVLFFVVCMYLAIKVFTTDKLFTMSFAVKSTRRKKNVPANEE